MEERGFEPVGLTGRWHEISCEKSIVIYLNFILKGLPVKNNFKKQEKVQHKHWFCNPRYTSSVRIITYFLQRISSLKLPGGWLSQVEGWSQCMVCQIPIWHIPVSSTMFSHYPYFWCNAAKQSFFKWKYFDFASDTCVIFFVTIS